jgi:uncharacterized protein (TIGR00369 family)
VAHLGIVYTRLEAGLLEAEMPVDARTHQPFGLLHGGASAALAETLGSMAGWLMTEEGQCVVGTELNATHHRAVSSGKVRGECRPLHLGRQSQSWEIVVLTRGAALLHLSSGHRGAGLRSRCFPARATLSRATVLTPGGAALARAYGLPRPSGNVSAMLRPPTPAVSVSIDAVVGRVSAAPPGKITA